MCTKKYAKDYQKLLQNNNAYGKLIPMEHLLEKKRKQRSCFGHSTQIVAGIRHCFLFVEKKEEKFG